MYNHLTLQMYDPTLTASAAMPATWGPVTHPKNYNRGAVADSAIKVIRVLSGRQEAKRGLSPGCVVTTKVHQINDTPS